MRFGKVLQKVFDQEKAPALESGEGKEEKGGGVNSTPTNY